MSKPPSRDTVPRLRRLRPDEIELWIAVATKVERRPGATLPSRLSVPAPVPPAPAAEIEVTRVATADPYVPPVSRRSDAPLASLAPIAPLAPLERKLKQRLSRGRSTADAALDLHGFRQNEAFAVLRHFLQRAQRDGCRVVLVVTGKGGRPGVTPEAYTFGEPDVGVLKRQVPLWLAMPEFRSLILGYEEAGRSHGGSGALYVRLRRG